MNFVHSPKRHGVPRIIVSTATVGALQIGTIVEGCGVGKNSEAKTSSFWSAVIPLRVRDILLGKAIVPSFPDRGNPTIVRDH